MTSRLIVPLLSSGLLAGCVSPAVVPLPIPDPAASAEVLVFRAYAFNAGGVTLSVGIGGQVFARLDNTEYVVATVPAGSVSVFVQARSAEATVVNLELKPKARTCLLTEAAGSNLAKVLFPPLLMASGYRFSLSEVACPDAAELGTYQKIDVQYRSSINPQPSSTTAEK
jgi:hypothetical protein